MVQVQFAEEYSPERCRWHRDESLKIARLSRLPRTSQFYALNLKMVVESVRRARWWNHMALAGGNEAYRYHQARA